jgi:hypothetical protein
MLIKYRFILLMLFASFLLSGCGGPSRADITKAVLEHDRAELQKQLDKLSLSSPGVGNVAIKMVLPKPEDLVVTHLKANRAIKNEHGHYVTTVSYTLEVGKETEDIVEKITLTKTKDGWKVIDSESL